MRTRGDIWALIVLLAVGALLRGIYLREIFSSPGFAIPQIDAAYHDYWARGVAFDAWNLPPQTADPQIRTTPFFRPPGYPYFLSLLYRLTGGSAIGARVLQMVLGLLSAFLAFAMGRRWFGVRMGLAFCGLLATYWGFIYFEGELLEPPLFMALILLFVFSLGFWTNRFTATRALLSGLVLGAAALVRPNVILVVPAVLGWAYWVLGPRRQLAIAALGFVVATGLAISPATLRNYWVAKDLVPISSNAGVNLVIGNNADADGTVSPTVPELGELGTCFDYPRLVRAVEGKAGRPLAHSEVSSYLASQARRYMWTHPMATVKVTLRKLLLFWGPREVGNNKEDELARSHSQVLRRIPGNFPSSAALFFLGVVAFLRRWKREDSHRRQMAVLVLLVIGALCVSYLPYFVAGRFRMPMVPLLFFFGAVFLDDLVGWVIARRWRPVLAWSAAGLASYALASQNFAGYEPLGDKWHFDRGVSLARAGHLDEAVGEYRAALASDPRNAQAMFNLGAILQHKGRPDEAMPYYEAALRVSPGHALAHHALAKILAKKGEAQSAMLHLQSALTIDPSAAVYVDYADLLIAAKRDAEALEAYQNAIRLDPHHAPAHNNLAVLLFLKGDYSGAWREVESCRSSGGTPSEGFVELLRKKIAE